MIQNIYLYKIMIKFSMNSEKLLMNLITFAINGADLAWLTKRIMHDKMIKLIVKKIVKSFILKFW